MSRSERSYHHGHLAPALEAAAMELLDQVSHTAVSLREVARLAGVSHNAPYHHFGDRTALLKRLAELCMADLLAVVRQVSDATPDPEERLRAIGEAYVGYAQRFPFRFGVIFDPEVCIPGAPTEVMAALIAETEEVLASAVRSARPGLDDAAAGTAFAAAWATAHGMAMLVIAGHLPFEATLPALAAAMPR